MCLFREPDAGNPPVRFDEREEETELSQTGLRRRGESPTNRHREATVTAPLLDSTQNQAGLLKIPILLLPTVETSGSHLPEKILHVESSSASRTPRLMGKNEHCQAEDHPADDCEVNDRRAHIETPEHNEGKGQEENGNSDDGGSLQCTKAVPWVDPAGHRR